MTRASTDMSEADVKAWLHSYSGITLEEARALDLPSHDYEEAGERYWLERTFMKWVKVWNEGKRFVVNREAVRVTMKGAKLSSAYAVKKS